LLKPIRNTLQSVVFRRRRLFTKMWYRLYGMTSPVGQYLSDDDAQRVAPKDMPFRELSFTYAVIALSARIACADGKLTPARYTAFRAAFPLTGGICGKLRSLFILACENPVPVEHYATQVKFTFPNQASLFLSLVERLFSIAAADGSVAPESERMLARIAHVLGISAGDYSKLRDHYCAVSDPLRVLGVDKKASAHTLKKRYHELMRRYHPDRFGGEDVSPDVAMVLMFKASEINKAYRNLSERAA
jgi:DnaJ like chaperone protein